MKNILITGGMGFVGSNLAIKYVHEGYNVKIYDNLDKNSGANKFNINLIKNDIEFIKGDILDFEFLKKNLKGIDTVINCAASTSHSKSMQDPVGNLDVNIKGVINILENLRLLNNNCKIIQIGTTTQIGNLLKSPANEYHPEFPKDIYSANKMLAEKYLNIYCNNYNIEGLNVRLPNTYGPRAAIHNRDLTFNNYFIGLALQNKPITIYGKGNQIRNVIYIDDVVNAIYLLSIEKSLKNEVFLVVSNHHYAIKDIAKYTSKHIGGRTIFVDWPKEEKNKEIGDAIFTNKKIKQKIKWIPKINLESGLKNSKEFFEKNISKYLR